MQKYLLPICVVIFMVSISVNVPSGKAPETSLLNTNEMFHPKWHTWVGF